MFNKLLTVGALAAGVLFAGTASANVDIPWNNCYSSSIEYHNDLYTKYLVKDGIVFLDVRNEDGIKWHLKGFKKLYSCGMSVYVGKYEGIKS
ncbi:hypothetical protein [Xenorhabdus sp. Sc-CR9]|uniref:hypothetical protein n=1 Tax=Xenorhabdus sp. Sc-CR9 TaxID=2584468 RepID=UPI001F1F10BB|nr:hypothetical protein [Xenorhabdus sp. Sc-CR9]